MKVKKYIDSKGKTSSAMFVVSCIDRNSTYRVLLLYRVETHGQASVFLRASVSIGIRQWIIRERK